MHESFDFHTATILECGTPILTVEPPDRLASLVYRAAHEAFHESGDDNFAPEEAKVRLVRENDVFETIESNAGEWLSAVQAGIEKEINTALRPGQISDPNDERDAQSIIKEMPDQVEVSKHFEAAAKMLDLGQGLFTLVANAQGKSAPGTTARHRLDRILYRKLVRVSHLPVSE